MCLRCAGQSPLSCRMPTQLVSGELPCGNKGGEVAGRTAGNEATAGRLRPAEQLHEPGERLVLGEDGTRSRLPASSKDVVAAHHSVEGKRGTSWRSCNVGEIHRIVLSTSRGSNDIFEDA